MLPHSIAMADGTHSTVTFFPSKWQAPTIVCSPAMGVNAGFYQPLAEALQGRALNVFTADLRGLGASLVPVRRGYSPGNRLGFGGISARTVIRDWARNPWTGNYRVAKSREDFEDRLNPMDNPVLALAFEGDGFAPLAAVRNLCRKMRQAKLRLVHLDQAAMNGRGLNHFGWVKHAAPAVGNICDWIASHSMAVGKKGS